MLTLYLSLAGLGLAAIDPVGIAIVLLLLAQPRPYIRTFSFLGGSYVSLMLIGLLASVGLGRIILRLAPFLHRFANFTEIAAGLVLLGGAVWLYYRSRRGSTYSEPSARLRCWIRLKTVYLFGAGALIVAIQSLLDLVFVIAMVRVGQSKPSVVELFFLVTDYALAALAIQLCIFAAVWFTPERRRELMRQKMHAWLVKYASTALIAVSLALGLLLVLGGIR